MGLTNIEAMDGYMLADKLTPRQFAELAGLDYEVAEVVYAAYAANQENYGQPGPGTSPIIKSRSSTFCSTPAIRSIPASSRSRTSRPRC